MALTTPRWVAVALAGCALVPVLVMRDSNRRHWWEMEPTPRDRVRARTALAQSHLERAAERLYLLRLRDSVRRVLAKGGSAIPQVHIDWALDPQTRAAAESLVRRAYHPRPNARVLIDVVVVQDTARQIRGADRRRFSGSLTVDYLVPAAGSREHCVALARIDPKKRVEGWEGRAVNELSSDISRQRLLGPCAFYEAFGHPGPGIHQWLLDRAFKLAQLGSWRESDHLTWSPPRWFTRNREEFDLNNLMARTGVACVAGREDACLSGMLEPASQSRPVWFAGIVSTADYNPYQYLGNSWYSSSWAFGSMESTMLADMVRTIGAERFAAFWRSELPPAEAFQQATGRPLADWTRDWLIRTYHAQPSGSSLARASIAGGFLLMALGAVVGVGAARRRQVT